LATEGYNWGYFSINKAAYSQLFYSVLP